MILTSVEKKFDAAIFHTIKKLVNGNWQGGLLWEDLKSDGVDLAPYHKTKNQVPGYLKKELKQIEKLIKDGVIPTLP